MAPIIVVPTARPKSRRLTSISHRRSCACILSLLDDDVQKDNATSGVYREKRAVDGKPEGACRRRCGPRVIEVVVAEGEVPGYQAKHGQPHSPTNKLQRPVVHRMHGAIPFRPTEPLDEASRPFHVARGVRILSRSRDEWRA